MSNMNYCIKLTSAKIEIIFCFLQVEIEKNIIFVENSLVIY